MLMSYTKHLLASDCIYSGFFISLIFVLCFDDQKDTPCNRVMSQGISNNSVQTFSLNTYLLFIVE